MGERFGRLPSELLGIQDSSVAMALDAAASEHLARLELESARKSAEAIRNAGKNQNDYLFDGADY